MKRGFVAFVAALMILFSTKQMAAAATATIEISTETETVRVDEEFTVVLTIRSAPGDNETKQDAAIGDFEAYLIYDADLCDYVSAPLCITGGDGMLKISDIGANASENGERTYRIRFRALSRGDAKFSMYTKPLVLSYQKQEEMSASYNDLSVTIQPAKDASENSNLSALRVSPGRLSPAFATTIREYSVTVPYETETIIISALTEDTEARVSVSGSTGLKVGKNTAVITVTAENGSERRYYLFITREEKQEETAPVSTPETKNENGVEAGIHAENKDGQITVSCGTKLLVSDTASDYIAPTGYEETILYLDGIQIKGYKKRGEPENDFTVLVLVDENGSSGYYSYDRVGQTIQRFDEGRIEIKQLIETDNSGLERTIRELKNRQIVLIFLMAMFFSFSILSLIILIRTLKKAHHSSEEDFEEDGFR